MGYGLKLTPEDDYEERYDALEADISTDETTTVTPMTTRTTKKGQDIKENTGTYLIF